MEQTCGEIRSEDVANDVANRFKQYSFPNLQVSEPLNTGASLLSGIANAVFTRASANKETCASRTAVVDQVSDSTGSIEISAPGHNTTSSTNQLPPQARSTNIGDAHGLVLPGKAITPSPSAYPSNESYVLLCTQTSSSSRLWHDQIEVARCKSDDDFFDQLRTSYKSLRGIRYWLDPMQYDHCEFVKYTKFYVDELTRVHQDLPLDKAYKYTPRPPG